MTAAPGEANIPTTRKTFIPLENNPSVFTHLAHHLGVSPTLAFYDIYTLTSPQIPRPAYALIFICPANVYFKARLAEYELQDEYQGSGPDEPVIWFKQTIRHACGLMSLLHAISNGGAKSHIHPSSPLAALLREATPLKTVPRAQLLYDSPALEAAHALAAQLGDTVPPPGEEENGFHFITFLKGEDGHLWELNGGMKGPVDRGVLEEDEDALSERALELGVRTFLEKGGEGEVQFSLVALAPRDDD